MDPDVSSDTAPPDTAAPITVLLVEDHDMVREAISAALAVHDGVRVVAAVASLEAARPLVSANEADVIVTELHLADGEGTEIVAMARETTPVPAVLLITGADERKGIEQALASGCAGFVSKAQGFDTLVDAIRTAARGGAVFPAALLDQALTGTPDSSDPGLSPRENEVLQLLSEALTIDEIAATLFLSPHTVRNHLKQVLAKLGARSQLEAVVIGARKGIVSVG